MKNNELQLADLIDAYEKKVPLDLSMSFDHNGLKIGSGEKVVKKILTALELTHDVVEYAIKQKIDVIFVHHDPMFNAPNYLLTDDPHMKLSLDLVKHQIALYVSHTNLDIVTGGLNDYIFKKLGGTDAKVLDEKTGIGRIGKLQEPLELSKYIEKIIVKEAPDVAITKTSKMNKMVETIAIVNGSGADFIENAYRQSADIFITGDVDYHSAMFGVTYDFPIIDMGHHYEYVVGELFKEILNELTVSQNKVIEIEAYMHSFSPWMPCN